MTAPDHYTFVVTLVVPTAMPDEALAALLQEMATIAKESHVRLYNRIPAVR